MADFFTDWSKGPIGPGWLIRLGQVEPTIFRGGGAGGAGGAEGLRRARRFRKRLREECNKQKDIDTAVALLMLTGG